MSAYQPFYCEENVWHLLAEPRFSALPRWALFISNAARRCELWWQRLSPAGEPVIWDYHVVALVDDGSPRVWDRDSRLPLPCPLAEYLAYTFRPLPGELAHLAPRFRVVTAAELARGFATDRRHMRTAAGAWREPPPSWPAAAAPGAIHNLDRFIDMDDAIAGVVLSLPSLAARFAPRTEGPHAD